MPLSSPQDGIVTHFHNTARLSQHFFRISADGHLQLSSSTCLAQVGQRSAMAGSTDAPLSLTPPEPDNCLQQSKQLLPRRAAASSWGLLNSQRAMGSAPGEGDAAAGTSADMEGWSQTKCRAQQFPNHVATPTATPAQTAIPAQTGTELFMLVMRVWLLTFMPEPGGGGARIRVATV